MCFAHPDTRQLIEQYFSTLNQWDETAHFALFDSSVKYFGTVGDLHGEGLATLRGVFRAARDILHMRRFVPGEIQEEWPTAIVSVEIFGGILREDCCTSGIWRFRYCENGLILELSIEWDPKPFLPLWRKEKE